VQGIDWDKLAVQCVRAGLGLEQVMNYTPHEIEIVMNGLV